MSFHSWLAAVLLISAPTIGSSLDPVVPNEERGAYSTTNAGITLEVSVPKIAIAGSPIPLDIVLTNNSNVAIAYTDTISELGTRVVTSKRKPMPLTRFGSLHIAPEGSVLPFVRSTVSRILDPGQTKRILVPLSRLYDLTLADTYTIGVNLRLEKGGEQQIPLAINDMKLVVAEPPN